MEEPKHTKPLLLQSGKEMMDTVLGERATDAALASGGDWVKAISERRMPSRHQRGQGR
jgi:hypothetical protein